MLGHTSKEEDVTLKRALTASYTLEDLDYNTLAVDALI
jgi:hypothetical protein